MYAVLTKCNTRLLPGIILYTGGVGQELRLAAHSIERIVHIVPWISRSKTPSLYSTQVGRRVWDDFAEKDKIDREKKKYPAQETLGYRIIGMRVNQRDYWDLSYAYTRIIGMRVNQRDLSYT